MSFVQDHSDNNNNNVNISEKIMLCRALPNDVKIFRVCSEKLYVGCCTHRTLCTHVLYFRKCLPCTHVLKTERERDLYNIHCEKCVSRFSIDQTKLEDTHFSWIIRSVFYVYERIVVVTTIYFAISRMRRMTLEFMIIQHTAGNSRIGT